MARPTEGNTYTARWEKAPRGYVAWLARRPKDKVRGRTEDELKEQLWELAMEHYGDGEACIELVPSLPAERGAQSYFHPEWFKLGSNEGLRHVGDRAGLFADGVCRFCRAGIGARNDQPRTLDGVPRSDFAFLLNETPDARIVTEAFLDFFGPLLGPSLRTIPCLTPKPVRKKFFELVVPRALEFVNHREGTHNEGVICPRCRIPRCGFFVCGRIAKGMTHGVSRDALAALRGPVHVAGNGGDLAILIDAATARRLRGSRLKGVLLDRLALLPADEIAPFKLRKYQR